MTHTDMKRCSTSPGIAEMQLKSAGERHFISIRLANIKRIISSSGKRRGNSWEYTLVFFGKHSDVLYEMKYIDNL